MADMKKLLHTFDEADELLNGKIERTNLSTIIASATASVENKKTVLIRGTGRNIESLKVGGRTVQDGVPTPDAPVEVKGVGDKTVNIFNVDALKKGAISAADESIEHTSEVTVLNINDKNVILTTTVAWTGALIDSYVPAKSNTPYQISFKCSDDRIRFYFIQYDSSKTRVKTDSIQLSQVPRTITTDATTVYIRISIQFTAAVTNVTMSDIMVCEGSTTTPYEPYGKYKIPVSCNGETTNIYLDAPLFDGEVADLVSGKAEKKWGMRVLDGTESIWLDMNSDKSMGSVKIDFTNYGLKSNSRELGYSNKLKQVNTVSFEASYLNCLSFGQGDSQIRIMVDISSWSDKSNTGAADWLKTQYNSGNPIIVVYPLVAPTTESFDSTVIPTTAAEQEVNINTELVPSLIEAVTFGDYYTKSEVDTLISNTPTVSKIYEANVNVTTANTAVSVDIPLPDTDGKVVMLYATVVTQSTTRNYIYSATFDIANKKMYFNATTAQNYLVAVYAVERPL